MATFQKKFFQISPNTADTTYYTCLAPNGAIIKEIIVTNTTATAASISLSVVSSGSAPGPMNRILFGKLVPAGDLIILALSTAMAANDFIAGAQGTPNALAVTVSGIEFA